MVTVQAVEVNLTQHNTETVYIAYLVRLQVYLGFLYKQNKLRKVTVI